MIGSWRVGGPNDPPEVSQNRYMYAFFQCISVVGAVSRRVMAINWGWLVLQTKPRVGMYRTWGGWEEIGG
eukprot:203485-Hanusia_phi.AAC.1